jgi:hypothetical protein
MQLQVRFLLLRPRRQRIKDHLQHIFLAASAAISGSGIFHDSMQIIIPGIDGRLDLAVSHGPAATDEHSYNIMRLSIIASKKWADRRAGVSPFGDIIMIIGSCAWVRCSARNLASLPVTVILTGNGLTAEGTEDAEKTGREMNCRDYRGTTAESNRVFDPKGHDLSD